MQMPFTLIGTDWSELANILIPENTSNPVFGLIGKDGTSILWLKYMAGVARTEFADKVVQRTGALPPGNRKILISDPEAQTVMAALERVGNTTQDATLKDLIQTRIASAKAKAAQKGVDLFLMAPAQGKTLDVGLGQKQTKADRETYLLSLLAVPACQKDMARMIAADLLLGNFDRFGMAKKADGGVFVKTNMRNFMVSGNDPVHFDPAAVRLLPIDNDTLAPEPKLFITGQKPTTEEVYQMVLKGACLNALDVKTFSSRDQISMDVVLGPQGPRAIAQVLEDMTAVGWAIGGEPSKELKAAAQLIFADVQNVLRELMKELKKNPGGNRQGLNELMKAQEKVDGMCYSTFKVKCRFAELMLSYNPDSEESMKKALAYGKYRDWKVQLNKLFGPVKTYTVPQHIPAEQTTTEKFGRAKTQAVATVAAILPGGKKFAANVIEKASARDHAHGIKDKVRGGEFKIPELRKELDELRKIPNPDRAVVKATVLVIAQLQLADLNLRLKFATEVFELLPMNTQDSWIPRFYGKAITKRWNNDAATMKSNFDTQVTAIKKMLVALKDDSGVGGEMTTAFMQLFGKLDAIATMSEVL
jgi:hypothetical protein